MKAYSRSRGHRKYTFGRPQIAMIVFVIVVAAVIVDRCRGQQAPERTDVNVECLKEVALPDEQPEIIVPYTGFTVSFNPSFHIPNYVAWELTAAEADGTAPRDSKFFEDPDVLGCPTLDDYRGSGFDRGHMAPAADMKWSSEAMHDSHSLVNMCPQDHSINSGRWSSLEKTCRHWARRDSALVIICGPVLSDAMPQTIGRSQVKVPRRFFKVVMAPFAEPVRAIAFIMPNSYTDESLDEMACSVDDLEAITGYDFFACLPDSIENAVESRADMRDWTRSKRKKK